MVLECITIIPKQNILFTTMAPFHVLSIHAFNYITTPSVCLIPCILSTQSLLQNHHFFSSSRSSSMSRIHPTQVGRLPSRGPVKSGNHAGPTVLTVWKKSSMAFQGTDGFSVFDKQGKLVFRVDNYSRRIRCFDGRVLLMDGEGRPLVTMRPKILSTRHQWNGFEGDGDSSSKPEIPVFSMRKRSIFQKSDEAQVFMGESRRRAAPDFRIEGRFSGRNCKILTSTGEVVAEVSRKRVTSTVLLGEDVFNLVIQPGYSHDQVMAFIVIIDRICHKPMAPILCSILHDMDKLVQS